jgi:hypothetical protein
VAVFNIVVLSVLLSLPVPAAKTVEKAFLQNSPEILRGILTARGDIPVSLPDPLSLADQLSPDQVYFVFAQIFSVYKTSEFFSDRHLFTVTGKSGGILTARWSFQNERTGNLYPFRVFIYLMPESPGRRGGPPAPGESLKIVEIRAERL